MRVIIFGLCAVFVLGIFVTMFVSIWSTSRRRQPPLHLRRSLAAEMAWAAIPCLMLVGAAIPAALVILTPSAAPPPEPAPAPAPARESRSPEPTLIAPSPAPASTGRTRSRWLNAQGSLAGSADSNNGAFAMLERDVNNIRRTLDRFARELLEPGFAREMLARFEQGELTADSKLTGLVTDAAVSLPDGSAKWLGRQRLRASITASSSSRSCACEHGAHPRRSSACV